MLLPILFIANVIMSVLHYMYESIYAPNLREILKFRLLGLRHSLSSLRNEIDPERDRIIERCKNKALREMSNSLDQYLLRILLVNSGGFFFWTWPVFLIVYHRIPPLQAQNLLKS